jgi:hypothetical protein
MKKLPGGGMALMLQETVIWRKEGGEQGVAAQSVPCRASNSIIRRGLKSLADTMLRGGFSQVLANDTVS